MAENGGPNAKRSSDEVLRSYYVAGIVIAVAAILALLYYLTVYLNAFGERPPRTSVERDVARYESIVAQEPKSATAWRAYSAALRIGDRPDQALKVVERGLEKTRNAPVLRVERAYVFAALGRKSEAIELAISARKAEEKRLLAEQHRLIKLGIDQELTEFDQRPRIEALILIGSLEAEREEYKLAIEAYTDALVSDPNLTDVMVARGYAHLEQGECSAAESDFKRALAIDSSNAGAIAGLSRAQGQADSQ
jgi:tetratricopeptide (TPR) repeat protein